MNCVKNTLPGLAKATHEELFPMVLQNSVMVWLWSVIAEGGLGGLSTARQLNSSNVMSEDERGYHFVVKITFGVSLWWRSM